MAQKGRALLNSVNCTRFRIFFVLLIVLLLGLVNLVSAWSVSAQTPPGGGTSVVSEQSPSPEQMTIRNLTASGGEPGTITIHWEPPLTWTQGYDIAWADRAGDNASRGSRRIYQLDDGGKLSHTLAGLVPGETYKIGVRASYSVDTGPWQEVSSQGGWFPTTTGGHRPHDYRCSLPGSQGQLEPAFGGVYRLRSFFKSDSRHNGEPRSIPNCWSQIHLRSSRRTHILGEGTLPWWVRSLEQRSPLYDEDSRILSIH